MCVAKITSGAAELQNPGFRSGMFPQSGIKGVPYTWGAGFPIANTPTKNLANNAIGNKERERRNTASNSTSSSSSNLSIRKESSSTKKRSVSSGSSKTSKSKRFSAR